MTVPKTNSFERRFKHAAVTLVLIMACSVIGAPAATAQPQENAAVTDTSEKGIARSLNFAGQTVHYEVYGDAGPTLVFVHGWASSTQVWKYQVHAFPDYRVIAVDLPGNGKSGKDESADYTMELFADAVQAVLQKERIPQAVLFGHSMGFAVVEVFAQKYPRLCTAIGSIDGCHFEIPDDEKARREWIEGNRGFTESLREEKGREDFINALFLPDTPELLKEEVMKASRQTPLTVGRSMVAGVEKDLQFWAKRTTNIRCLAIHSPVYQLTEEYKNDFMKMYPRAEYHEIAGVSHFLMLEIPYRINQMIYDYLKTL